MYRFGKMTKWERHSTTEMHHKAHMIAMTDDSEMCTLNTEMRALAVTLPLPYSEIDCSLQFFPLDIGDDFLEAVESVPDLLNWSYRALMHSK